MHRLEIDFDTTYTRRELPDGRMAYLGDDGLWVESITRQGRFYIVWHI